MSKAACLRRRETADAIAAGVETVFLHAHLGTQLAKLGRIWVKTASEAKEQEK